MSFEEREAGRLRRAWRKLTNIGRRQHQDPSQAVSAGVFQTRTAVRDFERLVNALGTPKDTPELREKLRKSRQQIGQLVKDTSEKLRITSEIDQHHGRVSTSKKIAVAEVAKDFQKILKEFQKVQRLAAERENAFSPLVQQASSSSYTVSEVDSNSNKSAEHVIMLAEPRRQEILFEVLMEEREQDIEDFQQQLDQIKKNLKDLIVPVHDRGTTIDDIDFHIENAYVGKSQLAKAAKTQRATSFMECLLLVMIGIVLLILIIVLAAKSRKLPSNLGLLKLRLVTFLTAQAMLIRASACFFHICEATYMIRGCIYCYI